MIKLDEETKKNMRVLAKKQIAVFQKDKSLNFHPPTIEQVAKETD